MKIEQTILANGLTVLTDSIPWVETVSFGLWIRAGSVYETPELNGAAHFFEHMAFKGTPKRDAREVSLAIERVGGYLNAYTSREVTAYHAKSLKGDLPLLVDVLSDIIQNPLLDAKEMNSERTVILQELMQSLDTPDDIIFDYFQQSCFGESSLARHILGTEDTIKALTPESLRGFVDNLYTPARTVAVASGNVSHTEHVAAVQRAYTQERQATPQALEDAQYIGGSYPYSRKGLRQAQMIWGYLAPKRFSPESYALKIATTVLSGGMSARLVYEVREQLGLVYTISAFYHSYQDAGLWGVYAGTDAQKTNLVIEKILKHMQALATDGPTAEEMEQARKQVLAQTHMLWESSSTRMRMIGEHYSYAQKIINSEEELEKLCSVKSSDVQSVMAQMLVQKPTCTILADKPVMPTAENLKSWGAENINW